MSVLGWIGRVLVLVLSALATLSIVASLVSVSAPGRPPESGPGGEAGIVVPPPAQPPATPAPTLTDPSASAGAGAGQAHAVEERESREIARWLHALTYAVLGLAGFVAVLAIVAMRATAHLGAIADRG